MVRTQVQFTKEQMQALRQLSSRTGRSVADLTRDAVNQFLAHHSDQGPALLQRALRVSGAFASGSSDGSTAHDQHLAEAFL